MQSNSISNPAVNSVGSIFQISDSKEPVCNVGDPGSIPGSGRSTGEGNGNPLQYFYLGNPMDRGAWWATVHGVAKSRTQLNDVPSPFTFTFTLNTKTLNVKNLTESPEFFH